VAESIGASLFTAAGVIRHHPAAHRMARLGLVARGAFYLILGYLTLCLIVLPQRDRRPDDAQGAMTALSDSWAGKAALGAAAAGFLAFAVVRLAVAWHDHLGVRLNRVTTCAQGLTYLLMGSVPASFLLGHRDAGSELQQHKTIRHLLAVPGGQVFVAGLGLILLGVCCWQIRGVLNNDYSRGLDLSVAPRWVRSCLPAVATVGIVARSLVFLPVALLLLIAAVANEPSLATGLNTELATLSDSSWGAAGLVVVSLCFVTFGLYSFLESWYKAMHSSD
jgi:hypothetical protein